MMDLDLLDNLSTGVIFVDKNKEIKYVNKTARDILNIKEGRSCKNLKIFDICKKCPIDYYNKHLAFPEFEDFNITLSCCSKKVCYSFKPVFENGEFVGIIEEIRDSTKVNQYIEIIKKEKKFSHLILDSVIDAIIVVDNQGKIINYNQNAKNLLCREVDIRGMNLSLLIKKDLKELPSSREDVIIETPAYGKIKVSAVFTRLKSGEGSIFSFYVVPDCMLSQEAVSNKSRLITKSSLMTYVLDIAKTVADTTANVLLEGESGTGKNVLAKHIHNQSSRRDKPFVKINCAAIPDNLLESELFGYVKGAFTGAVKDKPGKVELADGGTLFLDEIGELPIYLQSKLLHLIQEKEFERLGDTKTRKVDVRIIAATNKDLSQLIKKGKFREDLYYRLKVISIKVPALRERKEDVPFLINYFIDLYSKQYSKHIKGISPEAVRLLLDYDYPGNIRELENIIERTVILAKGKLIEVSELPDEVVYNTKILTQNNLDEEIDEKQKILRVLESVNWNKSKAAKILNMDRVTLWRKLKKYGLV